MGQEEGVGQRPDPARDRRDRRGDIDRRCEVDIAHDPAIDDVDPDIDHDRTRLEHRTGDEPGFAGGNDHDVGTTDVAGKIARAAMADADRGVLLDQQERRRHPDHRGSTDHHGVLTRDLDARPAQDLDRGVRGCRQEPVVAEAQQAGIERMDAVDVLGRVDRIDDRAQPDRRRQRHLDDDAIDGRIGIEVAERGDHRVLGRFTFELDELGVDPDLRAAAQDLLEVDGRGCVAPDDEDRQPGRATIRFGERDDVLGDRGPDLPGDR